MTAAPEPTTYLALVVCHPLINMVVAPQRDGPIPHSHGTCGPAHRLAHTGLHRTKGLITVCSKMKEKATAQHTLLLTNAIFENHDDDHDADRQYEGPPKFSDSGTPLFRLPPQAQEKETSSSSILDGNDHDLEQPEFAISRYLRLRRPSLDA